MTRSSRTTIVGAVWWAVASFAAPALAADVCGETVPANRFIDGFPAYAQCPASTSASIYSNDGIATSTMNGGAAWVRTQGSGGYQCTELAHRYLHFRWNLTSVPNGNAGVWCDGSLPDGLVKATTPVHGDLIVLAPGSCGADAMTGHVAVVDVVNADSSVSAVQQNSAGRGKYNQTCAACFLHVVANDGSVRSDAGAPSDAAGPTDAGATTDASAGDASPRDATTAPPGTGGAVEPMGSGGRGGTGGAAGTGGTGGAAGTGGTGGVDAVGTGGSPGAPATGGASGPAGGGPGPAANDLGGACACAVDRGGEAATHRAGELTASILVALLFVTGRRRRPGGRCPPSRGVPPSTSA